MPKNPDHEGSPRLLTIDQIAEKHGVSRSSVHTYRRGGTFPRPVAVEGTTRVLFDADEVAAWFEANPKQQGRRSDIHSKKSKQGEPVSTTIDARKDLYAFAMQGKENSPAISDRASVKIDAFRAAVLREAADALDASETLRDLTDDHMHDVNATANELRRMANEPQDEEG